MQKKMMMAAVISGILGSGMLASPQAEGASKDLVKCVGANSCKGQSECSTASNSCGGQNGCSGKGWKKMSEADCNKLAAKNKGKIKITAEPLKG
jgi:hypothetical protein